MDESRLSQDTVTSYRVHRDSSARSWCFQVLFRGGLRVRRRAGPTKRHAEDALHAYVSGLPEYSRSELLSRGAARFCERTDITVGTARCYRATFNLLLEYLGDVEVGDVGEAEIRGYVDFRRSKGLLASTLHADIRRVRALFRWLGYQTIPTPKRLGLPSPRGRLDFFSISETAAILSWADRQDPETRALVSGYLFTGGRAREVLELERSDVDLMDRWVTFRLGLKGGETRKVPIAQGLVPAWQEHVPKQRGRLFPSYTYARVYQLWKRALRESRVRDMTLHHARHTCASLWVMAGIDLVTVKTWLGHSSIQQTMIYAKVSPQHGQEAMGRFHDWISARM